MPCLNTQETKQLKGSEAFIFEIEMNYSKMVFKGIVLWTLILCWSSVIIREKLSEIDISCKICIIIVKWSFYWMLNLFVSAAFNVSCPSFAVETILPGNINKANLVFELIQCQSSYTFLYICKSSWEFMKSHHDPLKWKWWWHVSWQIL